MPFKVVWTLKQKYKKSSLAKGLFVREFEKVHDLNSDEKHCCFWKKKCHFFQTVLRSHQWIPSWKVSQIGITSFQRLKGSLTLISYEKFIVLPTNRQGWRSIHLGLWWMDIVGTETIAIIIRAVAWHLFLANNLLEKSIILQLVHIVTSCIVTGWEKDITAWSDCNTSLKGKHFCGKPLN